MNERGFLKIILAVIICYSTCYTEIFLTLLIVPHELKRFSDGKHRRY